MHGLTGAGPGYRIVLISNQRAANLDDCPDPGPAGRAAGAGGPGPLPVALLAGGGASVNNLPATLRCDSDSGLDQELLADSLAGSVLDPEAPSPAASDNDAGDNVTLNIM